MLALRRCLWLPVALLLCVGFLGGCDGRSTTPQKVERGMFDKRKMPARPEPPRR